MDSIDFKVNGEKYSVGGEVNSSTTLLEYLRRHLELRGTKYMCLEGGCGACIVNVIKSPGGESQGINSCMVPITSCCDWEITTIEKLGNRKDGYHVLQKTLAEANGSQCGYCSPGWIMALYSILKNKKPTMLEMEQSFGSNICRCTGYRPILKAFKRFASDADNPVDISDIEDLELCKKIGDVCSQKRCDEFDWCVVSKPYIYKTILHIKLKDERDWYKAEEISDIFDVLRKKGTDSYMLVAGNTAKGVYPILEYPKVLINISGISDLRGYSIDQNLIIGSATTLTELIAIFDTESTRICQNFQYLRVLNEHLKLVANITIRNLATIGGNLIMKNRHSDFQSDIYLLLETVGAQVTISSAPGRKRIRTMQEFLNEDMKGKLILNILLRPLSNENKIVTYKIMPRSQNAHALINAGFLYKINKNEKVLDCRIVYGGLSSSFNRSVETEKFLMNKELFENETLEAALRVLNNELDVTENLPNPPVEYRRQTALALFYKGLLSLCPESRINPHYLSGASKIHKTRPVSETRQIYDTDSTIWPLNEPIPRINGVAQCAGESKYIDDIPKLPGEVFAAFVLSSVALGTISNINSRKALALSGVIAFYTAKDIPGRNSFVPAVNVFNVTDEELLCNGEVKYYHQPLGIIVANSQTVADKAVTLVEVFYTNVRKPVLDIKIAKNNPTRITLNKTHKATAKGIDVSKIIKGEKTIYTQYAFPMETLVCVTNPTEDELKVYSSTQWINAIHIITSRTLLLDQNKIKVHVQYLGGSYGIKMSRTNQVSLACNLVAYKQNRPCRFVQNLTTNLRAVGKRLPCSTTYEVGVNTNGVIQYVNYKLYCDNGYIINEPIIMLGIGLFNNVYKNENWDYKGYDAVTDTPSNSWCRSPGSLEHIAMAEYLLERIAYELDLDPIDVRVANIDTTKYNDILDMINTLKVNSQYDKRKVSVKKFNSENRWKKQGLRVALLRWQPVGGQYLEVNMCAYSDDGTIALTHGGIEMGQGINTKAIQMCAHYLGISIDKIKIKANDTFVAPNCFASGGSFTAENITIGIRKCCEELLKRLEPIKNQMSNPTWEKLIQKAFQMDVDLQVHGIVTAKDIPQYTIYGVTIAEVEIDVLTGEWEIKRVDLSEDVGRSVNPELDLGQIEGAFLMGVGYATTEQLICDPNSGQVLTDTTWNYWVPGATDIPQDMRVYFRKRSFSNKAILGSKATGEPATCMGVVIPLAMRAAIAAARQESCLPSTEWFPIDGAYTVDKIGVACATKIEHFKFF